MRGEKQSIVYTNNIRLRHPGRCPRHTAARGPGSSQNIHDTALWQSHEGWTAENCGNASRCHCIEEVRIYKAVNWGQETGRVPTLRTDPIMSLDYVCTVTNHRPGRWLPCLRTSCCASWWCIEGLFLQYERH